MLVAGQHIVKELVLSVVAYTLDILSVLCLVILTVANDMVEALRVDMWLRYVAWILVIGYLFCRGMYWYWKQRGKRNQVKHFEKENDHTDDI